MAGKRICCSEYYFTSFLSSPVPTVDVGTRAPPQNQDLAALGGHIEPAWHLAAQLLDEKLGDEAVAGVLVNFIDGTDA